MCKFKSGIILKGKVILAPEGNESHSDLLESLNIEDTHMNASKVFVRVELVPPEGNISVGIKGWEYIVDQDIIPDWYKIDSEKYENQFRDKVREYIEKRAVRICDLLWTTETKDGYTYYFLYGTLFDSEFGRNNNFAESDILAKLREHTLTDELKEKFGDKLVPITLDLTAMDGLKDYGKITGDVLSIPTVEMIMEFGENIPPIGKAYWTPTPNQTPTRRDTSYVLCVLSDGCVVYCDCRWDVFGVRPFFILKSDIFVSID